MRELKVQQSGIAVIGVIAALAVVLALGGVSYYYIQNKDSLDPLGSTSVPTPANTTSNLRLTVEEKLEKAKERVIDATNTLRSLVSRQKFEQESIKKLSGEYQSLKTGVIGKTDVLFLTPSTNPTLAVPAMSLEATVEEKRQKIEELFNRWDATLAAIAQGKTNDTTLQSLIDQAKADANAIKDYVEDLKDIVDDLGPSAGVTPQEIDEYQDAIEDAMNELEETIDDIDDVVVPQESEDNNETPSTPASGSQTPSSNDTPLVTPDDIEEQEEEVEEAQEEQEEAEEDAENQNTPQLPGWTNATDNGGGSNNDFDFDEDDGEPDPTQEEIELIEWTNRNTFK